MFKVRAYIEYECSTKVSIVRNIRTIESARNVANRIIINMTKDSEILKVFGDICESGYVVEQFESEV